MDQTACIACREPARHWAHLPSMPPELREGWEAVAVEQAILWQCQCCRLRFRTPLPSPGQLLQQYQRIESNGHWDHGERSVWRDILRDLGDPPSGSVLDVGCFRGDFLSWLPATIRKFGIEPSDSAAATARSRGVEIVARSIDDLQDLTPRFTAVTLIDVIEHLPMPLESLRLLAQTVLDGGRLILFTGNTAAWPWRIGGRHYWYSRLPDHVAFFRREWFEWAAPRLGCRVLRATRLAHRPAKLGTRVREVAANLSFFAYRRLADSTPWDPWLSRLPLVRKVADWRMAWWTSATDHILVVMEKKSALV